MHRGRGWETQPLGERVALISGQHVAAALVHENSNGTPYLTGPADFPDGTISVSKYTSDPRVMCDPGDVLLTVKGSGTGKSTVADAKYCISRQLMAVRAESCSASFLSYLLAYHTERFRTDASGLIPGISREDVLNLSVGFPPPPEQHQIAEVLDTVDAAIRRTEEVLAKLELVKKGLLHDLLTRGIDENGELRDPERHPEQFKESELGRIPRGWSIRTLESVGFWLSGGTPSKAQPSFWGGAIPWVSPKDMKSFFLLKTQETVTEVGLTAGSRLAPRGTVLIVVRGMILAHTFPVSLTLTDMAFNQDVKGIVPHDDVSGKFLAYWLRANDGKMLRLVTEATHGTKRLDLGDVQRQMVAIPHLPEQRRIVEILEAQEGRLLRERQVSDKLRLLKKALMDDLLTGKVRVTPLLEREEEEPASEAAE